MEPDNDRLSGSGLLGARVGYLTVKLPLLHCGRAVKLFFLLRLSNIRTVPLLPHYTPLATQQGGETVSPPPFMVSGSDKVRLMGPARISLSGIIRHIFAEDKKHASEYDVNFLTTKGELFGG